MRVIVTGGCGFIGSNFLKFMVENKPEFEYVNIDKLTYSGLKSNVEELEEFDNYQFVKEDICNEEGISKIIQEDDVIINFAAESHVDRSIVDSLSFTKTNVFGTGVLLDVARHNKAGQFIQMSTDEVYGSIKAATQSFENDKLNPSSPYSASKASADLICLAAQKTYGQDVIIVRCSNNYGPNQFPEKIIPFFTTNLVQDKKVPLYSNGENIRDWIFVEETCRALNLILEKGQTGDIYNVGAGNEISNIELTKKILHICGKDDGYIEFVKDRPGHDFRYSVNTNKIKKLGWELESDFETTLKETVNWYITNRKWWENII